MRLVAAIGFTLYGGQTLAQTTGRVAGQPNEDASEIQEIVVTAERRGESINDIPASVAAVTSDQLRAQGVTSVADLEEIVPGFHFAEGTYSAPVYSIRGVGFNESTLGAKPDVSLAIDDAPLPFPIMADGIILDLARVEVLKGPQGTLYGQNATGGAINFVSAKPTDTFEAGTDLTYGRFNDTVIDAYVSGPLSNDVSVRLAASTEQSSGWQQSYTRRATLGAKNLTEGRFLLDYKPTDQLKVELALNAFYDGSETQAAQLVAVTPLAGTTANIPLLASYPLPPANDRAADWAPGIAWRRESPFYQGALHVDYNLSQDIAVTSITSFAHYVEKRWQDPDGTSLENEPLHTSADLKSFNQELRLAGTEDKIHWIVGANYEYDRTYQRDDGYDIYNSNAYALIAFGPPFHGFAEYGTEQDHTASIFGSLDYTVIESVTAHAGVRYTQADISYSGCTADTDGYLGFDIGNFNNYVRGLVGLPPNPPIPKGGCVLDNSMFVPGLATSRLDQSNVPWHLGLDWKPFDKTMIYADVGRGYKSGSYPLIAASVDSEEQPVRQESVLAYELGLKTALLNNHLQFNVAAFHYDYLDKQLRGRVVVPVFGALETLVNVPKSRITGAEFDTTWRPIAGLTATVAATYVNSRIGNFTNYNAFGVEQNFTGEAFPLTPNWQISSDIQYDWPVSAVVSAFAGTHFSYQSRTNGGLGNQALLNISGYGLLDLRVGLNGNNSKWKAWLWGRNVTDRYYWTNADRVADTTVRFAGVPATYGISGSYAF